MIKFFRRIRARLITESIPNETSGRDSKSTSRSVKYLLYAFGEIILVVIGILIALQINNWNQNRIRSIDELSTLKALKTGLEKDQSDLIFNTKRIKLSIHAADQVINTLENDLGNQDSVAHYMGDFMFPVMFRNSTSAFETLKSKGIGLINNSDLRDKIIDVYDSSYNFFKVYEAMVLSDNERGINQIFPLRFQEGYVVDFKKPDYGLNLVPLDYEALKADQEFIYYVKTYKNKLNILLNFHYEGNLLLNVRGLLESLETEIAVIEK